MPIKDAVAKTWPLAPSADGRVWSRYPNGDALTQDYCDDYFADDYVGVDPAQLGGAAVGSAAAAAQASLNKTLLAASIAAAFATGALAVGSSGLVDVQSNPVTTAISATGSGTLYTVTDEASFDAVPWSTLTAGSVVALHWKSTPYARRVGIITTGTQANRIKVYGVTDAQGNRPRVNLEGSSVPASSAASFSSGTDSLLPLGGWYIKSPPAQGSNRNAWVEFHNIEFFGCKGGVSYTGPGGTAGTFDPFAAALHFRNADDCALFNCVVYDNNQGLFTQSNASVWCNRIKLYNNRFYGNGNVGRGTEHNVYIQCSQPVMIGNYFGPLRAGADGSSVKSRCTDQVIAYNNFECGARMLDLVHPEDDPPFVAGADMKVVCYGNTFANDRLNATFSYVPIHVGGDNSGEEDGTNASSPPLTIALPTRYVDKLYFFNNTYVTRRADNTFDRVVLFDLSLTTTEVIAWNNILATYGATPNGWQQFMWAEYAGIVNRRGANLEFGLIFNSREDANASKLSINQLGTAVTTDPLLTNLAALDYSLQAGSPARGQAQVPTGVPAGILSGFPVQYQPRQRSNGLVVRNTANDLGAFEYS